MSLLDILIKGGWLMVPIGLCSVIAIGIIIERLLTLSHTNLPVDFIDKCKAGLQKGDRDGVVKLCTIYDSPVTRVIKVGIINGDEAMSIKANEEIAGLERFFTGLATVVGISPLLGFLGTVTGMIRAFMQVQQLGGNVNASVLAGGIWEALVTTAAGLGVGIIAYIFYNYLTGKVRKVTQLMQTVSHEVLKCE